MSGETPRNGKGIRNTATAAAMFALAMVALAFASVPLYRIFCQATGFNGTTQRGTAAAAPSEAQVAALRGNTVIIRFDGNTAPNLPWKFQPEKTRDTVQIGERRMAFFRATNLSDKPVTGSATFNVSPDTAGLYFVKIACFCFTQQTLAPGETVDMPVTYYVDPAFLTDPDASKIEEITLSYTFYPSEAQPSPDKTAAGPARLSRTAEDGRPAPQVQG